MNAAKFFRDVLKLGCVWLQLLLPDLPDYMLVRVFTPKLAQCWLHHHFRIMLIMNLYCRAVPTLAAILRDAHGAVSVPVSLSTTRSIATIP